MASPLRVLVAAVIVALGPGIALAQDDDPVYARNGVYFAVEPIFAVADFDQDTENTWGVRGFVGYRLLPYLGLDFDFESAILFRNEVGGGTIGRTTSFIPSINARGYPLTGRWQPYGVIGFGPGLFLFEATPGPRNELDAGFTARAGVGVDLYDDENVAINIEGIYVIPTGAADDRRYGRIAFGILWRP
jgi:hypothetical protein